MKDMQFSAPHERVQADGSSSAGNQFDADTSPAAVHQAARRYAASGLSVIPISAYGTKSPDTTRLPLHWDESAQRHRPGWHIFQVRQPRAHELQGWLESNGYFGLAVVGGLVSGGSPRCGLEIIDFDTADLYEPWKTEVDRQLPGLCERLVRIISPRPGIHVYFRCQEYAGNRKLACGPARNASGQVEHDQRGRPKKTTLIEVKGEGGYCIVPPSPRSCHPSYKCYRLADDSPDLTAIPTIAREERAVLLKIAGSFDQWGEPAPKPTPKPSRLFSSGGHRPGDDFNRRAAWRDILVPHGWTLVGSRGEIEDWCRPGKHDGLSATVNYADSDLLYVFSCNAYPLEEGKPYSKFEAYALLEHEGDYRQAAGALRELGYGEGNGNRGERSAAPEGVARVRSYTFPRG